MSENGDLIEIEKMSIDQFAGSVVLILGAIGSLLLVIWQSRCACKCRVGCSDKCYIFDCSRDPPPIKDDKDKDKDKDKNKDKNKDKDKDKDVDVDKNEEIDKLV
jgi:hypothetical protein